MPFSHHSHSGQFCPGHASDSLEEVIQAAISKGMLVFGLTEHMPRHDVDQYPEERETGSNLEWHFANEAAYVKEALRLREKYQSQIEILIGFECDWIRPESQLLIERSIQKYPFDFFVGSVHHVHTIPIDYDDQMYSDAKTRAGGTEERLFEDYFDAQFEMLKAVRPPVVGHFDLIRLKSSRPNDSLKSMAGVWQRIKRNLEFVTGYNGILELNTAALRKGMDEPYPKSEICQEAVKQGAKFCLSDDSHGISQIAYGYDCIFRFLFRSGIERLCCLKRSPATLDTIDERFQKLHIEEVEVAQLFAPQES